MNDDDRTHRLTTEERRALLTRMTRLNPRFDPPTGDLAELRRMSKHQLMMQLHGTRTVTASTYLIQAELSARNVVERFW